MPYEVNFLSFQNLKTNHISQIAQKYILKLFLSPIIPQNKTCNKFQRKMKYTQCKGANQASTPALLGRPQTLWCKENVYFLSLLINQVAQ